MSEHINRETARLRLSGCYVTVPTMFRDDNQEVDLPAIRKHVRFLIAGGLNADNAVLLAGGAAGDFSTMTIDERLAVTEAIIDEAKDNLPVVMGAQTTDTRQLVQLAKAAARLGAEYIQVSPPFYFAHTADDIYEHFAQAADAAAIGLVIYNTFWTSSKVAFEMVDRLCRMPNVIGLKWSCPDMGFMEFEQVVSHFAQELCIIDNQLRFVTSHILGARAIEVHVCNYWPQWGVRMWSMLEKHEYVEAQKELVRVALPFYELWLEMEQYTSGDGYLDKLCMELVGLDSSRCRPPTRDVRQKFKEKARQMLIRSGVPGVKGYEPGTGSPDGRRIPVST